MSMQRRSFLRALVGAPMVAAAMPQPTPSRAVRSIQTGSVGPGSTIPVAMIEYEDGSYWFLRGELSPPADDGSLAVSFFRVE